MTGPVSAHRLGVITCHACGLVCEDTLTKAIASSRLAPETDLHVDCPRCGAPLHRRRPNSIPRAWALLLAGLIFYIPANVLPVMYTSLMGSGSENTIMQGVIEFWKSGSYGIALVIFIASVLVPCTKFVVLGVLFATSQRRSRWAMKERAKLYRLVELVGYWSMLDVLVVAIVAALVKFQGLSDIEPRIGILFFGMVVIMTMLSAMSFDPRLIWDGDNE
ncbi:paraquat-inducible protein A [Methylovorus sp. SPW-M1]